MNTAESFKERLRNRAFQRWISTKKEKEEEEEDKEEDEKEEEKEGKGKGRERRKKTRQCDYAIRFVNWHLFGEKTKLSEPWDKKWLCEVKQSTHQN